MELFKVSRSLSVPMAACCGFVGAIVMLVACAETVSTSSTCPAPVSYSKPEQLQILQAYKGLPSDSILRRVFQDYEALRDADRACRGEAPSWGDF